MSRVLAEPLSVSADRDLGRSLVAFVYKTAVVAEFEIRKLTHDPTELITRAMQPALWLLIFGEVFTRVRAIPTGGVPYARVSQLLGKKNVYTDAPTERVDTKILETLIDLDPRPELPLGLRVQAFRQRRTSIGNHCAG